MEGQHLQDTRKNSFNSIDHIKYSPKQAISILIPVSLCMFLTILIVTLTHRAKGMEYNRESLLTSDGYKSTFQTSHKDSLIFYQALSISFLFICGLVISTLLILFIIYLNLIKLLAFLLSFTILVLFMFVSTFFGLQWPLQWI